MPGRQVAYSCQFETHDQKGRPWVRVSSVQIHSTSRCGIQILGLTTCNNKMSMSCLDIKSSKIPSRLSGLLCSISHLTHLLHRSLLHRLHLRFCMNRNFRPGYSHVTRGHGGVSVLPNMETRPQPWHSPFVSPSPSSTRTDALLLKVQRSSASSARRLEDLPPPSTRIPGILQIPTCLCL